MEQVWGYDYYGDLRAVDVAIRRLREKGRGRAGKPRNIITKRGMGYYFADGERSAPIHSHGGVILFRSLHMKLVLILVLMIVSVMAVVGTFPHQQRQHVLHRQLL